MRIVLDRTTTGLVQLVVALDCETPPVEERPASTSAETLAACQLQVPSSAGSAENPVVVPVLAAFASAVVKGRAGLASVEGIPEVSFASGAGIQVGNSLVVWAASVSTWTAGTAFGVEQKATEVVQRATELARKATEVVRKIDQAAGKAGAVGKTTAAGSACPGAFPRAYAAPMILHMKNSELHIWVTQQVRKFLKHTYKKFITKYMLLFVGFF